MSTPTSPPDRNRRVVPRRAYRQPATVLLGGASRAVQTWDLGRDGMCLLATRPIAPGTRCQISFELPVDGESVQVTATAKVVYSSYSAAGEFKIGAVFTGLADDVALLLSKFATGS